MIRRTAIALAALTLAATAALAAPVVTVQTQAVRVTKLTETVTAWGRLVPDPHSFKWISAAQAGRVTAVLVTPGSRVARGQPLVRIAPTPKSRAAFESARSALASARAKLKQTKTLASNGLATQSDLESARGAMVSARAKLDALEAEGGGAKAHAIEAQTAGVVTKLPVTGGQWIGAGARIAAIAPSGALWVRLGLDPAEAARIHAGAPVRLVPVFGKARGIKSKVAQVAAQANPATGLIDAEIPVAATSSGPLAGEWVKGVLKTRSVTLPVVPRSAVLKDGGGWYVFVVRKRVAHRITVKPVARANGLVGLSGVKAGEIVVTQGNFELHDGEAVRKAGR